MRKSLKTQHGTKSSSVPNAGCNMALFKACAKSEVAVGGLKFVNAGGQDLVIANVDGKFYALDNWCTHEQGNLSEGELKKSVLTCPEHGAQFDVSSSHGISHKGLHP